ncbi:MAG: LLM class flavin-dependent oxidoreductase [Gemmatimonadota bacterium]
MTPISCWLLGSETLLLECAGILLERGHDVRGVVTQDERVAAWGRTRGVPVVDASTGWEAELIAADPFDVLFAITHPTLVPEEVLALPRRLAVNFHDGPLPRYAGLHAPVWALLNREREYGITWHVMTPGVDQGPVLRQVHFAVAPGETALSLNTRCLAAAVESFPELLSEIEEGREEPVEQDLSRRSVYRRFDRPPAACLVDWSGSSEEILAFVRALTFGPHENPVGLPKAQTEGGEPFVVERLSSSPGTVHVGEPGEVLAVTDSGVRVTTGDGVVEITAARALDGSTLEPGEVAERYRLSPGIRLVLPDDPQGRRVGAVDRRLAPNEPFWVRRLRSAEAPEMPLGSAAVAADGRGRVRVPLSPEVAVGLQQEGRVRMLAAVSVVLARFGPRDRVHVAVPAAGEAGEGFYARWVPAALPLDPSATLQDVVDAAREESEVLSRRGSFLRDLPLRIPELAPWNDRWPVAVAAPGDREDAPGSLVTFRPSPDGGRLEASFAQGPLTRDRAEVLARSVAACLDAIALDPKASWTRIPLHSTGQTEPLVRELNSTGVKYDRSATIPALVLRQARETPDRLAVSFEGRELSYRELVGRASALSRALMARGVGPGDLVGIHVDRCLEMPVAVLGVLLSGAAYLPLDPGLPRERIRFMLDDADALWVVTPRELRSRLPEVADARVLMLDELTQGAAGPAGIPASAGPARPADLAYVIYTSGSTGRPNGVLVEHRNVVNFFAAMDRVIPVAHRGPRVWLAVTSLSFDISVLELLWTLTRGFEVAVYRDRTGEVPSRTVTLQHRERPMAFGLFLWGNDDGPGSDKYRLMLEGARFFDENGFESVWTPERHFHAFGGPFPNPSVTGAALAVTTRNLRIRSGSCVSPLHHPIRIAEEWGVVDNLSDGRVDLAFAAGWQPDDFILRPESFGRQKSVMVEQIDTVRRLWRGEPVEFETPAGGQAAVITLPRPVQPELPVWVTTAGDVETYRLAGALGANVLTHLLGQGLEELGEKIDAYRHARAEAGFEPGEGIVSLMLHTFVGESDEAVRDRVRDPMKEYLRSSTELLRGFAWSFPAFKRPGGALSPGDVDLATLSEEEVEAILDFAFDRYFETSGLFGTPERCAVMVDRCKGVGVDEIACLLDFGVDTPAVLESLPLLKQVRDEANAGSPSTASRGVEAREEEGRPLSFAGTVEGRQVTHLQCTPSMARMLLQIPDSAEALRSIPHLFIGGEVFPAPLADPLLSGEAVSVTNMYGPTETTVWSLTHRVRSGGPVPIGRPLANTRIHVLDRFGEPVPVGVAGDLWIAGEGVARGYHRRPELTAERFVPDPFDHREGRMYRTGDRVRIRPDGVVEFLGRVDQQVKLRGHRIELGEIERCLEALDGVAASAVALRTGGDRDARLEAFVVPSAGGRAESELKASLRRLLPEYMIPSRIVTLETLPLTPNGKLDRAALPEVSDGPDETTGFVAPRSELEERLAACWRTTLGREHVGIQDNFFDVGGHSLLVVRLHRALQEVLDPAPTLVDLYRFPTIQALSRHLAEGGDDTSQVQEGQDRGSRRRQAMARRRPRRS